LRAAVIGGKSDSSIAAPPQTLVEPGLVLPALSLCQRELVRFLRQRHRVIGALATPIVFWLLIGGGMGHSFSGGNPKQGYMQYFFPGTVLMILLVTMIVRDIFARRRAAAAAGSSRRDLSLVVR